MTPEEIARVCHEVNRALCISFGDYSQPYWNEAPDWQRQSALSGVLFYMWNPDAGPEESHEHWYAEKRDQGWLFGPVKDAEAKTHPCMVPFEELPRHQQLKDHLFKTIVNVLGAN
ncbi:MAG: hypothetical protein RLZ44_618 [Pseudomonadota bacterium]